MRFCFRKKSWQCATMHLMHVVKTLSVPLLILFSCTACTVSSDNPSTRVLTSTQPSETFAFTDLPFHWSTQEEFSAAPTSRPATPDPCFPSDFTPSKVQSIILNDRVDHFIQRKGTRIPIQIEEITDMYGVSTAPFSFKIFTIDYCHTASLLVQKDGTWHAYYSNIILGERNSYSLPYNAKRKELILHNIVRENGGWVEKVRLIDIPSKKSTELPLDFCAIHSVVMNDGTVSGGYMEAKADAPSVDCLFTREGKLVYKLHPLNAQGTSLVGTHLVDNGRLMIAIDINSHILRENGVVSRSEPEQNRLIVLDMVNKNRWATYLYPDNVGSGGNFGLETSDWDSEYDFSQFSWDDREPIIRFRLKIFAEGQYPPLGEWLAGPWHTLRFDALHI